MTHPDLRITDLRVARVTGLPTRSTIIRISTDAGLVGYGEGRDLGTPIDVLELKPRLLGENPCDLERLFRRIKPFGGHGRRGGGVSGVEMALMDLAGKAWGVPAYALLGGRYRDRVPCYATVPKAVPRSERSEAIARRVEAGFRLLKLSVGVHLLDDGHVRDPLDALGSDVPHPFTAATITSSGIAALTTELESIRAEVPDGVALAVDHVGHLPVDSCRRLLSAWEPLALTWVEDLVPWQYTGQWRDLTRESRTPTCTGEDIYALEGFEPLIVAEAVRIVHPDPTTAGGMAETKRIAAAAAERGIAAAFHLKSTPIAAVAAAHVAAATESFIGLEFHAADLPDWARVVGSDRPLVRDGFLDVPDAPGLGIEVDEEFLAANLDPVDTVLFAPTGWWDGLAGHDRVWS